MYKFSADLIEEASLSGKDIEEEEKHGEDNNEREFTDDELGDPKIFHSKFFN